LNTLGALNAIGLDRAIFENTQYSYADSLKLLYVFIIKLLILLMLLPVKVLDFNLRSSRKASISKCKNLYNLWN